MSKRGSAVLSWVKPDESGKLIPVSGCYSGPVTVRARSVGAAPETFAVWHERFASRLLRALHLQEPELQLVIADGRPGCAWSEPWRVNPPGITGQATYRCSDGHGNRSGRIVVTTGTVAIEKVETHVDGELAKAGSEGVTVKLPFGARRTLETTFVLNAPGQDPEVVARLLVPGGDGDNDLNRVLSDYLASLGEADVDLQGVSEGFLATERPDWELSLDEGETWGERQLVVEPGEPRAVVVRATLPERGGRLAFTLLAYDVAAPDQPVVAPLVEVEYDGEGTVRISGDTIPDEPPDLTRLVFAVLGELGVDDPDVDLFRGTLEDDLDQIQKAIEGGADPNARDAATIARHVDVLSEAFPDLLEAWQRSRQA